jgi:hypothetical protein
VLQGAATDDWRPPRLLLDRADEQVLFEITVRLRMTDVQVGDTRGGGGGYRTACLPLCALLAGGCVCV